MMTFQKGAAPNIITAPITQAQMDNMQPCALVNPKVGNAHGFVLPDEYNTLDGLMDMAGEVDNAVNLASRGKFDAGGFAKYWPEEWGTFDDSEIPALLAEGMRNSRPVTLAQNVQMDQATEFYNVMQNWVMQQGYRLKNNETRFKDFLGHNFDDAASVMARSKNTMHKAFEVKSFYLVPRPEEVLGRQMTLYDNGCPCHGECVSGHTTAAFTQVMNLRERFDLDRDGLLMLLRIAWHVANSRTIAGVHYYLTNYLTMKWVIENEFDVEIGGLV